ncbi:hypothetical protein Vafri_4457 [Volvox africanus]|uniref:Glycosyl transferase 64 domain-containing protein n=1 Tax=Volvox africanus TaxID=51714 RepID=A0A8J4EXC5_9CHLO|nr:hypothetical protein Vafri_4457 [Volvox africanus]
MLSPKTRRKDPKKTDEHLSEQSSIYMHGLCGHRSSLSRRPHLIALLTVGVLLAGLICLPIILRSWSIVPQHCMMMPVYHWPNEPIAPPRYHGPPAEFTDRYTLILNSYKRPQLLQRAVAHYSQCKAIDAVRVVWCEDGLPPNRAEAPGYYSDLKEVRYDIVTNSSLNNRFWPLEGLRTEAVLSLDDDIVAPCEVLDQLFVIWRRDPYNMAGFYPRLHVLDQNCKFRYLQGFGTLFWHRKYSLVLTKAAMLHRDYLEYYTNHMDHFIRRHVDAVHNCEDLAMALLVGSSIGRPPAYLAPHRVKDLGKGLFKVKGISSGTKHGEIRSTCLNVFAELYRGAATVPAALPLVIRSVSDQES